MNDLSHTIKPKSDQLNADDLIAGAVTVTVQAVHVYESPDQPVAVEIGNGFQPYKPCKSMRRLMIAVWGKHDTDWIGQSMTLYCDPSVKWAGMEVGGIRISHMTGIDKPYSMALTATRGKRKPYTVQPLQLPDYSKDEFDKNFPAWSKAVESGKFTAQEVINRAQQKGLLTDDMKSAILAIETQQEDEDM